MKASVVIPTLNRKKDLAECLESIFSCSQQSSLQEVIVIDNKSDDGTLDFLKVFASKESRLKFTQISERDAIKARNLGFGLASGNIIVHIDDDILVDKEWLRQLIAPYSNESVGGVGGRIIELRRSSGPNTAQVVGRIAPWGQFFTNFDTEKVREVEFLHGSNMSFRKNLVMKVKGLDSNYKINWRDDTDLCIKVRKLGYKLLFQPAAIAWHKGIGSGTRFSSGDRIYRYFWNRDYFYYKNVFTLKNIPWSSIFTLSEAAFCLAIYARHPMTRYLGKCLQGMREGSVAGLRYRCKSGKVANP